MYVQLEVEVEVEVEVAPHTSHYPSITAAAPPTYVIVLSFMFAVIFISKTLSIKIANVREDYAVCYMINQSTASIRTHGDYLTD